MSFNQRNQPAPRYDLFHLSQETLTASLLAFTGVLEIGKTHLTHGRQFRKVVQRKAISAETGVLALTLLAFP